jgi:lactate racemase
MARQLYTRAWYGDEPLSLDFPSNWQASILWPNTPPPLDDRAIEESFALPVGQRRIADLVVGKTRPLVVVDDLTRPTPAAAVVPFLLREFAEAGLPPERVTFVAATGTHGPADPRSVEKKIGAEAAARVRVVAHDHVKNVERVGRTSFGTPVFVNRAILSSDFVMGIGGIYPQHSTGFGGGSKLALGVCGYRTIRHLHYRHQSMAGSYEIDNDFRRDLDEIARMIGLRTLISVHVDESRRIVRVVCGDHNVYYRDAVEFARNAYAARLPGDADVVISNAYPIDVSLTFMRSKGVIPLLHADSAASRIIVAACPEGVGHHGLFPFMNQPRFARQRHVARLVLARPADVPRKVANRMQRKVAAMVRRESAAARTEEAANPIWLYVPGAAGKPLPTAIPGMTAVYSWAEIVEEVEREQSGKRSLKAVVYPCAPLQVLDLEGRKAAVELSRASGATE